MLSDPEQRERARRLWLVSWPFLAVVALILGIAVVVEPATAARRATTIASVAVLVTVLHQVSRSGRPQLASWLLAIGLSVLVTQRAWITGGIHAPVAVFYALFIVMAGALLGKRGAIATAGVCLLGAVALAVGTAQGWLVSKPGAGSAPGAFVFVLLAIGLALVLVVLIKRPSQPEPVSVDAVQMLVHDMRSPMQVLLAHLEFIREDTRDEGREDIEAAIQGAKTLDRMTTSLLDASRLQAGRMPLHRAMTDLSQLVRSVVAAMHILQPSRVISVEERGDTACECDPELMRRVIENLLGNALKHTPDQSLISIAATGSPSAVAIAVTDQGPGVPVERRTHIFHPYNPKAARTASGHKSFGVGLVFCRLAVEAHGGTIRVEEGPAGGSVFVVELPRTH